MGGVSECVGSGCAQFLSLLQRAAELRLNKLMSDDGIGAANQIIASGFAGRTNDVSECGPTNKRTQDFNNYA